MINELADKGEASIWTRGRSRLRLDLYENVGGGVRALKRKKGTQA